MPRSAERALYRGSAAGNPIVFVTGSASCCGRAGGGTCLSATTLTLGAAHISCRPAGAASAYHHGRIRAEGAGPPGQRSAAGRCRRHQPLPRAAGRERTGAMMEIKRGRR
jgi:hypothetical protein